MAWPMWWDAIPAFLPVQVFPVWVQAVHQGQLFGRQLCCFAFGISLFCWVLAAEFRGVLGFLDLVTCSWVHEWLLRSIHGSPLCLTCIWRRWQVQCVVLFLHVICEGLDIWYYICIIFAVDWWIFCRLLLILFWYVLLSAILSLSNFWFIEETFQYNMKCIQSFYFFLMISTMLILWFNFTKIICFFKFRPWMKMSNFNHFWIFLMKCNVFLKFLSRIFYMTAI